MPALSFATAKHTIPNPFRTGDPLDPEAGPELFRGRESAIREVEQILADPDHSASILLLGPRRCGKSSLLKMLPAKVPDAICVFFDLQHNNVSTAADFLHNLSKQTAIQAKRDRRVEIPALPEKPTFDDAIAWFEKLDHLPQGRRVLIAIDEFRRLEELSSGSRQELLQLMGLLRATIQHRKRVRLLVAGDTPFDELDPMWDDHFISARPVRLDFLDRATSIGLLTRPEPGFREDAIPAEVADRVYERTGGQPYLLQIFGSLLVSRLNEQKRKSATADDVDAAQTRAIEWASPYFSDTHRNAPDEARAALVALAAGNAPDLTPIARRWLTRRLLLTPDHRLAVPLFAAWLEHHAYV